MTYTPTTKTKYVIETISAVILSVIAGIVFHYVFKKPPTYISAIVAIIFWTNTTILQTVYNIKEKVDEIETKIKENQE